MKQQKHPLQHKPGAERQSHDDHDDRVKPNPAVLPSESAVGEEDPGDFENASIRRDDGHRNPDPAPSRER
ncbi:hypothetical protein [Ralstonia insidiosa]|uniref:hypothetical protein n=1 Tax=Ralstonia insidiosa TaxID=190721 RepID=UPI000CEE4CFF|nr:hypothetical protein [Ralstonia insidiosa]